MDSAALGDSTPESRNDRRRLRTRNALVAAAREVFATRGLEAATIQEITDAADVAKGSFYNHFDSREDILQAVVAATLDRLGAALDDSMDRTEEDPAVVIARSLYATVHLCVEDPIIGGFVLRSVGVADIAEAALGDRGRRDLREGIERGRFRALDFEMVTTSMAGATAALIRKRLNGSLEVDAEVRFAAFVLEVLGLESDEAAAIAADAARSAQ